MRALLCFFILTANMSSFVRAQDKKSKGSQPTYLVSGDAQIVTHFIDKGISYSDGNPAMNASFLFNLGSQARLGFWGSNISNVNASDDNFWFKILGEISVDFSGTTSTRLFFSDNRFYKSNQRNGQIVGAHVFYKTYTFGFEWMSNLDASDSNAEYFLIGKLNKLGKNMKYGGYVGYTASHGPINSYVDLRGVWQYIITDNSLVEAGLTYNSNNSQFGKRGDPAYYVGIKLSY